MTQEGNFLSLVHHLHEIWIGEGFTLVSTCILASARNYTYGGCPDAFGYHIVFNKRHHPAQCLRTLVVLLLFYTGLYIYFSEGNPNRDRGTHLRTAHTEHEQGLHGELLLNTSANLKRHQCSKFVPQDEARNIVVLEKMQPAERLNCHIHNLGDIVDGTLSRTPWRNNTSKQGTSVHYQG